MSDRFAIQVYDTLKRRTYHLAVTSETQFKAIGALLQPKIGKPTDAFSFQYNGQPSQRSTTRPN